MELTVFWVALAVQVGEAKVCAARAARAMVAFKNMRKSEELSRQFEKKVDSAVTVFIFPWSTLELLGVHRAVALSTSWPSLCHHCYHSRHPESNRAHFNGVQPIAKTKLGNKVANEMAHSFSSVVYSSRERKKYFASLFFFFSSLFSLCWAQHHPSRTS